MSIKLRISVAAECYTEDIRPVAADVTFNLHQHVPWDPLGNLPRSTWFHFFATASCSKPVMKYNHHDRVPSPSRQMCTQSLMMLTRCCEQIGMITLLLNPHLTLTTTAAATKFYQCWKTHLLLEVCTCYIYIHLFHSMLHVHTFESCFTFSWRTQFYW